MTDIIEKLAKILNQAENASTPEEADAFLTAAQVMSTKYSIGLAEARAHTAKTEKREDPVRRTTDMADFGRNAKKHLVRLYQTIAEANDVRIDVAMDSSRVYPYGFPSDIDLTDTLFAHLAIQMVDAANKFISSGEFKSETVTKWVKVKNQPFGSLTEFERVEKPIDGRVARTNFYRGFISKVGQRLKDAKAEAVAEAVAVSSGTELVLADKTQEVYSYYKKTSNAKGSWGGPSSSTYSHSSSNAGSAAGARARLSGQGSLGGAKGAISA